MATADLACLPYVKFYLARYEGEPASTCMTIADGDIATLEMVVTRPEMRRRSIAAATARAAMNDLRAQGVRSLHLRSEPDAIPFYESLGFRMLGRRIVSTFPGRLRPFHLEVGESLLARRHSTPAEWI